MMNEVKAAMTTTERKVPAMTKTKATIVTKGMMGNIVVKQVWLIDHGRGKYAQYPSAVFIKYIDKGARTIKGFWQSYAPYLVILAGWQDIQTQSLWGAPSAPDKNGTTVSQSKYASFDEGWARDFEAANKLENIIADYRGVNTMRSMESLETNPERISQ